MSKRIVNKTAFDFAGVNYDDYLAWCKYHRFQYIKQDTRKIFFVLLSNKLITVENGRIIEK